MRVSAIGGLLIVAGGVTAMALMTAAGFVYGGWFVGVVTAALSCMVVGTMLLAFDSR